MTLPLFRFHSEIVTRCIGTNWTAQWNRNRERQCKTRTKWRCKMCHEGICAQHVRHHVTHQCTHPTTENLG